MTRDVELVVAMARGGAIGRANALPWRLPEDLRRFRALTIGHAVVMGRRTWESIGRSLPGRTNIVISRDASWRGEGAETLSGLDDALARAAAARPGLPALVIGGAQIYALALPLARRIRATEIELDVPGADAFFPALDRAIWRRAAESAHVAADGTAYRFVDLERRAP
jgi:dihydrofolate reductase